MISASIRGLLIRLCRRSWVIDTGLFVPSDQTRYLHYEAFRVVRVFKYFKRYMFFIFTGQRFLEQSRIPTNAKKVLWVNLTAASIGDAVMDTASRVIMSNFEMELLTSSRNSEVFFADPIFREVHTSVQTARVSHQARRFDFCIIDSYSPRSIVPKLLIAPLTPFAGLYGFLNGFEVHRTYFSFYRAMRLLELRQLSGVQVRQYLWGKRKDINTESKRLRVAIAIGGEWEFRRYREWVTVIEGLMGKFDVVLVGSKNGVKEARILVGRFPSCISYVGSCTLPEVVDVISECDFFVGADGGLWHIASGLNKPSVVLFADCQLFDESLGAVSRITRDLVCVDISHPVEVSAISPKAILKAVRQLSKLIAENRLVTEKRARS